MNDELKKILEEWGQDTVTAIQATLVAQKNIASRTLLDSIEYTLGPSFVEFTMAEYGHYLDQGVNKGWYPPIGPLKTWARLKRLPPSAAFVARASIKKRGLKPRKFFDMVIEREVRNLLPKLDKGFIEYIDGRIKLINESD